jgi:hypothetical protein
MNSETKICQSCKQSFILEPDDFAFYERMKVPPPTWCPMCQLQRRFCFRNERTLYKRKETLRGDEIISSFAPEKPYKVLLQKDWWGDTWDPMDHGRDYDFSKPFFEQFRTLILDVPWPALTNWNAVNSDYCNYTADNKDCYLLFGSDFNENCAYGYMNFHSRDSFDLQWSDKMELSYECVDVVNSFKVSFCQNCRDCTESTLLFDCANCHHCVGCSGLRNKSYYIFNEPYSKEEYERKVAELRLGSHSGLEAVRKKFLSLKMQTPHKFADIYKSTNCTGDKIQNSKNCHMCFDVFDNLEDCKNTVISAVCKDTRSADHVGWGGELVYDSLVAFSNVRNVRFSALTESSQNITYSFMSSSSSNLFGCVGLRSKQYCVFNKQYSKEDYEALIEKIVRHMDEVPYTDATGKIYRYGEFFPAELSPFAYNESIAQEHFPLTKERVLNNKLDWREGERGQYEISMKAEAVPDAITEVGDTILKEVIECAHQGVCMDQCSSAFRIIPSELAFYRKAGIRLPVLCPNCRHYERLKMRNPMKLWHRRCMCDKSHPQHSGHCPSEFETSYAPDRREIVYCEQCYQAEVA